VTEEPALVPAALDAAAIENVLLQGDLGKLTPTQRVSYYLRTCESLGLNPLTKPFDYISLNGKLTLYPKRDCTDQLRKSHKVSIEIVDRTINNDLYIVRARATMPDGRCDESLGAVSMVALKGEAAANAIMKAETKAKRRVTLSICGLGMVDESEIESIGAEKVRVDLKTGEITGGPGIVPGTEPPTTPSEVSVVGIEESHSGPRQYWVLSFSDGTRAGTTDRAVVDLAEIAKQTKSPVEVSTEQGKHPDLRRLVELKLGEQVL